MLKIVVSALGLCLASVPASSQHAQPYAGMQDRQLKALSEREVADLKAGRGMGLALPAELNGYPGPLHAIELADQLGLSLDQRDRTRALYDAMRADAVPLGEQLIEQEARLDHLFASRTVTEASLAGATREIGRVQAELRNAHLKYHLAMVAVLTADQVKRYGELRGYGTHNPSRQHRHH